MHVFLMIVMNHVAVVLVQLPLIVKLVALVAIEN
jgi:hypothetical protein